MGSNDYVFMVVNAIDFSDLTKKPKPQGFQTPPPQPPQTQMGIKKSDGTVDPDSVFEDCMNIHGLVDLSLRKKSFEQAFGIHIVTLFDHGFWLSKIKSPNWGSYFF